MWPESGKLGLAVSGGPDSLALLLLAAAVRPDRIEAATVDHGLRPEAAAEAANVAALCASMGVSHRTLPVVVGPGNLQAEARAARYEALGHWMGERGLDALATAHHADDQAETLVMRLNRSSGLAGLAGVRARGRVPGSSRLLLRPLLGWRRAVLGEIVAQAGVEAASDVSNIDPRFDRVRLRRQLAEADWLNVGAWAESACYLAEADSALEWAAEHEWEAHVEMTGAGISYRPHAPPAIRMRVVARIVEELGGGRLRGAGVARMVDMLGKAQTATLGGVMAKERNGVWLFTKESRRG